MAYLAENRDNPEVAKAISRCMERIATFLADEEEDIKINAVCRLAVSYLSVGTVTKAQAQHLFMALIDSLESEWMRTH